MNNKEKHKIKEKAIRTILKRHKKEIEKLKIHPYVLMNFSREVVEEYIHKTEGDQDVHI